jgi:hypothetical protein
VAGSRGGRQPVECLGLGGVWIKGRMLCVIHVTLDGHSFHTLDVAAHAGTVRLHWRGVCQCST